MDNKRKNNDKENKTNSNNNLDNKNEFNNKNADDTQFYLITLEDNNGDHQQIKIFKNSDPSEISFNFCKENNLDFKSMKYIKKNIQKIIEQFDEPNHKLFFLDNSYSSIQEVDEENLGSENTAKSKNSIILNDKEKNKNNNKDKNNINCVIIEDSINIKDNENNEKDEDENIFEEKINKEINDDNKKDINEYNYKNEDSPISINEEEKKNITYYHKNNSSDKNKVNINKKESIDNNIDHINEIIKNKKENKINDNNIKDNKNTNINKLNNNTAKISANEKILKDKIISLGYQDKETINEDKLNIKEKDEENSLKNNEFKKIKKLNINNYILNDNDKKISSNNKLNNRKIKLQNIIPKIFKYMNPKQHLINEEYKTLIKKEPISNRENSDNIIHKYLKYLDKNQKLISKHNLKTMEKDFQDKDKSKANKTFLTISNSNLNIRREKEKEKNCNHNICDNNENENNDISFKYKKKNNYKNNTIQSVRITQKINQGLSNYNTNSNFQENDLLKKKEKINKEKCNNNLNNFTLASSNIFFKRNKASKSNMIINHRKKNNSKIRNMLNKRQDILDNILSNTFIDNNPKKNRIKNNLNIGSQDRAMIQNKSTKNKVIIKRNKKNIFETKDNYNYKYSTDMNKFNEINQNNNFIESSLRTFEGESGSKGKRISEIRSGLNKMFTNFIGQKSNILNTNYIINKRCRIINNKNKKNMSMNLSRYFLDYSHKKHRSPKYNLEINVSNNNIDNLNFRDFQTNTNHKILYNKNNNTLINKNNNSNKKNYYIMFNSKKKSFLHKYNTNIRSSRFLNTKSSYSKKRKKIISSNKYRDKNHSNNTSVKKTIITSRCKDINNLSISNSLLINNDKINHRNDCCLKILDQYYTINNTINITNNNSLLGNFPNNNMSNKKYKHEKIDKNNIDIKNIIKNIFKCLDRDRNGFIILSNKQKINYFFNKNNLGTNREFQKILEKMIKYIYEINRKYSIIDFEEDKIIINENNFIKYMINIYNNKLNIYEKKIFLSSKNNIDKIFRKDFLSYNFKPKSSFNKLKDSNNLSSYNSSCRLKNKREYKSISNDINKYFFNKMKKNDSKKKLQFNSFNYL